eukprot:s9464_g3.t1
MGVCIMLNTNLVRLSRAVVRFSRLASTAFPLYRSQHVCRERLSSKHTDTDRANTWAQNALYADEAKDNCNCWQSQQGSCSPKLLLVTCGRRIKWSPAELTIRWWLKIYRFL